MYGATEGCLRAVLRGCRWPRHARRRSKACALTPREHAGHAARGIRAIVEERRRPAESEHPPAEYLRCAAGKDSERRRRGRVRRQRPDSGAFVDAAERRAEQLVPGTTVGPPGHERMSPGDDRGTRAGGGVGGWGLATNRVTTKELTPGDTLHFTP